MVRIWFPILDVCGRDLRVTTHPGLKGHGDSDSDKGLIRVRIAERSVMEDTLVHEVTHQAWDACGLSYLIRTKYGLTEKQAEELEEDVIRFQTPALLSTFKRAGWLTIPAYKE